MSAKYVRELDSYILVDRNGRPVRLPGFPLFYASKRSIASALAFA